MLKHFRETNYPIGSGTVESVCKLVMQERMKQAGMRWSRDGAQAILALRSVLLNASFVAQKKCSGKIIDKE